MKIKEPRMKSWVQKKRAIPRHFVVIVVIGLRGKGNRKFALFKWIRPFLRGDNIANDAL